MAHFSTHETAQFSTITDTREAARNLAAFVDGYEADLGLRADLPAAMHRRAAAMYDLLRSSYEADREPWGTVYAIGHGDH